MRKHIVKIAAASLWVAALATTPLLSQAADAPAKAPAAADSAAPAKAKKHGETFVGNLTAVDATAMTLTVSNLTLQVTSDTIIKKGSQPAKLSDGVVGQPTRGTYEKNAEGKLVALTVHLNSKAGGKGAAKGDASAKKTGGKKKKDAAASSETN